MRELHRWQSDAFLDVIKTNGPFPILNMDGCLPLGIFGSLSGHDPANGVCGDGRH